MLRKVGGREGGKRTVVFIIVVPSFLFRVVPILIRVSRTSYRGLLVHDVGRLGHFFGQRRRVSSFGRQEVGQGDQVDLSCPVLVELESPQKEKEKEKKTSGNSHLVGI